ncbi:MAG: Phospholipase, patatin family [uncultured bacterium (gcode 4)]|uniref:Phospholipase, patatin family n=1 Tax=uncultured bacterium (gcode 4) TaxID=1234023 RepID=K2FEY2_9BACT|nr:MAG: Phospholipase, patatin family [uncultured bacterium (gcode 4)]
MLKIFSRHKDFWLALGWWAARWLAHIWIIKFLEENDLRPSEISWTSMGSIIWALYAFWKTSDEMREIVSQINFLKLIDFNMRRWLIAWNKIKKYLIGIFWDIRIEELKIPIKIISTDISSWEKMIFDSWNLVDAIRSSISIPWIIMPYALWNKEFVDGWLINNLPIEVLAEKNILAVSVLRDISRPLKSKLKFMGFEMKHNVFWMNYQILQKAIDIMMKQNEDRSLHSWKNVILLHPNFPWIDYYEFNKYDEIINIWYKWAHSEKEKFKELL